MPFVDCVYGDSPFNLIDGSEITVGLQNLPNATLVSVDSDGETYDFDFWGPSTTLPVNAENFYMIPNLGMFIDTYDLEEPLYQDGYLDLYYGSGTEIDGEDQYTSTIFMDYAGDWIADYQSYVSDKTPTSWENTYNFADQFITTDIITVEGRVFYHQLFDLDIDINSSSVMNDLFPDYGKYIFFGLELPQSLDIDEIRAVGDPYSYSLSIQGFPIGKYKEDYCVVDSYYSGSFDPIQNVLENDDYALEYDENGTTYILFFRPVGDLDSYTDTQKKIMIDYWVNYEFMQNYDYYIHEDPEDPYISQIEWDYSFIDEESFHLHPDLSQVSFTVEYSALEWEIFNQLYIEDGIDIFTFQPKEYDNISMIYTGESSTEVFSIEYIVPEGQYKEDHLLFPSIYVLAQLGDNEDTMRVLEVFNDPSQSVIEQNAPESYNYTIDFNEIETYIQNLYNPNYQLVEYSFLYILTEYDSILLRYPMEHTLFNYDYLGEDHDAYHIALSIDGQFIAYSNETEFHDYVLKIENGYIYFNNKSQGQPGYIDPQNKIKLEYKFKLQPGLLDRKHFLIVTYPWTNVFENSILDPVNTEKYRKLSGGSIITPFEYSLSIDNKYSLYLSYRLNQKDYYEEHFEIASEYFDSAKNGYVYEFMSQELANYVDILNVNGKDLVSVYYFDRFNQMRFLDSSYYEVNIGSRQVIIKNDENPLALQNSISEFYVSIIPDGNSEFASYRFTYDSSTNITNTINVNYWDVIGVEGVDVIPNLDAYYFINEKESYLNDIVCHASQLAAYLKEGDELEFNLEGELASFDEDLLDAIHNGEYLSLYFDTNMKNIESLEFLTVELYDNQGLKTGFTRIITRSDLEMWDYNIKVDLPTSSNTLKKVKFTPTFRTDNEYYEDNTIGIARIITAEWDNESVSFMDNGQGYMHVALEFDLKTEFDDFELAYIFNDKLQYLTFLEDFSLNYSKELDIYTLHIPAIYLDPDTNETVHFREGEMVVIRYNSPVKRGLALGIGKIYFEKKEYNYQAHPEIPKAEFMLVEAASSEAYSEFTSDYYYQAPLQLTPFDTEYNNRYKTIKIDLNLTALYELTGSTVLNFTHLLFSVPDPSYELTVNEVLILEEIFEPTTESGSMDSRVWQYTEVEWFEASKSPEKDTYQLTLENIPVFYPDYEWLDFLNIYDEDGNYYTAGLAGNDHQLHFEPSNNTFTWNPSFNQFPEYFGMEFEEPLIIEPYKTLYFEYVSNTSWTAPIRVEVENIDLDSIRVIYDYNYLLKPEHYDWYIQDYNAAHSYENIAYSFKEEVEYRVVQYYYEFFTVYTESTQYTHTFDIGDLSFDEDFVNLSLYKVIGLTPTFESEILTDNNDYSIEFNTTAKTVSITDLNTTNGYLNIFDQITVILNYSYAPVSSYSEIYLLSEFNQTYLYDIEETFYNYVDIDYLFLTTSGVLFAESSSTIISDLTSFEPIDYCRNPDMSDSNKLIGYGSEYFDNFEIYQDEASTLYTSDINMDGEPDYKHTIDVNKDGKIDVIRYGINDPQGSGEIYWHTVIQDFEGGEVYYKQEQIEELRTEWYDLEDQVFANYDFNVGKLIAIVLTIPLLAYHITKMMLPDVDYWAQKSSQQLINKEEHIKSDYYSVKVDENLDGLPDSQINYEKIMVSVYYEVNEYREVILAAKRQDIFTYLTEYVARSVSSFKKGYSDDLVFNDRLTKERLEAQNFSACSSYTRDNAGILRATYRKFTEDITTTYIDTFEQATMTIIDYDEEGEIVERRIYKDDFESSEVEVADKFFSGLSAEHSVTNIDTGRQYPFRFDPEIPFSHPANISWDTTTWGPDQVSVKYDSLEIIGEDYSSTTNVFEKTIIIRIPNRYSLYYDFGKSSKSSVVDDGWVEFEVTGMLVTPQSGQVYYTSDMKSFLRGRGKVSGHYFYVDSDQNGYFETVYILSSVSTLSSSGIPIYDVMSIGYNCDGIHDFAPYEKLTKKEKIVSDFRTLAREKAKFGSDWVYNFNNLKGYDLIWGKESIWDEYKPKDQIFEIHKLVETSKKNKKFSELFYEVRHSAYSSAWDQYRDQLIEDIAQQVFMSVIATALSIATEALVSLIPVVGGLLARILPPIAYFATYTLMTKFFIDIKLHEAESIARSDMFYPASDEINKPHSLNEKSSADRLLKDSTAAALIGHPGGYYTTVSGGEPGNMYTGHLLVSPPNSARKNKGFGGFFDLLWDNFLAMGESDPDVFYALDFDDKNLDYLLLSSELSSYNRLDNYEFDTSDKYNDYWANTLGYLAMEVSRASNNQLDMIRAICVDGRPHYEFINSSMYEFILPQSVLYKPVILSGQRYDQLQPELGHLVIQVQCPECAESSEVNVYEMNAIETLAGYKAKVPLNDLGFEYPIDHISIDVVKEDSCGDINYFAQDLIVNETYYAVDSGNLYFTLPVEEIISEKYQVFDNLLQQIRIGRFPDSDIYYDVHVYFNVFVPDTTEETHDLALAQATFYTIMDYFNQYTYAEVTANMISEIAYTETLTFWSTLISAPLIYFGSWTVKGTEKFMKEAGTKAISVLIAKGMTQIIAAPIKEVFQEIIMDGFTEALVEGWADLSGCTEDQSFWLSSMATSARETTMGALAKIALGKVDFKTGLTLLRAYITGGKDVFVETRLRLRQEVQAQLELKLQAEQKKSTWQRLFSADFFKGFFMVAPTFFFGSFNFLSFSGLATMLGNTINVVPEAYISRRAKVQAYKRGELQQMVGGKGLFSYGDLFEQMKKPADIDGEALNNIFRGEQETGIMNSPAVDISVIFKHPLDLAEESNTIAFEGRFFEWTETLKPQDRFAIIKDIIENVEQNYREIKFHKAEEQIMEAIQLAFEEQKGQLAPSDYRFFDMWGTAYFDPHIILCGVNPQNQLPHGNEIPNYLINGRKASKELMLQDLQQIYGVGVNLEAFTIDGIKISDDTPNVDKWLIQNNYPGDTKIVVVPSSLVNDEDTIAKGGGLFQFPDDWRDYAEKNGIPSPNVPFVRRFLEEVAILFEGFETNLVGYSSDQITQLSDHALSQVLTSIIGHPVESYFSGLLASMKNKGHSNVYGITFDSWYLQFKDTILASNKLMSEKLDAIKSLDKISKEYTRILGLAKNDFARDLRLTILRMQDFFDKSSLGDLEEIVGWQNVGKLFGSAHPDDGPRNVDFIIEKLVINPLTYILTQEYGFPADSISNDFKEGTTSANFFTQGQDASPAIIIGYGTVLDVDVSSQLSQEQQDTIMDYISLIRGTVDDVLNFHNAKSLLDSYADSLKKDFWSEIFTVLNRYIDNFPSIGIMKLCDLIFYDIGRDLTSTRRRVISYRLSTIENIKYNILRLTPKQVKDVIKREITGPQLKLMQGEIIKEINDYYLSLKHTYFSGHNDKDRELMIRLSTNLIMTTTLKTGKRTSFETLREVFKTNMFTRLKVKGFPEPKSGPKGTFEVTYFKEKLEKVYHTVYKWFKQDLGSRQASSFFKKYKRLDQDMYMKFYYYSEVLDVIAGICRQKGYDIASPTSKQIKLIERLDNKKELIMDEYDLDRWGKDASRLAHRVFHLCKYLGFDSLFFTSLKSLDDDMGRSRRHHFIAVVFRKMSSYVRDNALTNLNYHGSYEVLFDQLGYWQTEGFIQGLLNSIEELIYYRDSSGKFKQKIEPDDIKAVLKKNLGFMPVEVVEQNEKIEKPLWEFAFDLWRYGKKGSTNEKSTGQFTTDLAEFSRLRKDYVFDFANNKINPKWQVEFLEKEFVNYFGSKVKDFFLKKSKEIPLLWKYFALDEDVEYMKMLFPAIIDIFYPTGTSGLDIFL